MSIYIGIDLGTIFTRVASTCNGSINEKDQVAVLDNDIIKRQIKY